MNSATITQSEADTAKLRAAYKRAKVSNPEQAFQLLKAHFKELLTRTAEHGPLHIYD